MWASSFACPLTLQWVAGFLMTLGTGRRGLLPPRKSFGTFPTWGFMVIGDLSGVFGLRISQEICSCFIVKNTEVQRGEETLRVMQLS